MFEREITGLDVGSYSAKAVVLEAGLRGFEIVRACQAVLPEDAPPEEREAALFDFVRREALPLETVIAALPSDRITQRHMRFPFSDPRRIQQAIPFEIEDDLPVALSQVVLTYEHARNASGQTDVLAVVSPRGEVGAWLHQLELAGIDPRILELDGAVLANLSGPLELADVAHLVIDVGHGTTTLCLLVAGRPVALRSIRIAGRDLTRAVAADLGLSPDAAQEHKHRFGVFRGETQPAGESVAAVLARLVRELRRSMESIVGDPLHPIAPAEVVLVGGSALLPGLDRYVGQALALPCSALSVPAGDPELAPLSEVDAPLFAQAAALALRGAPTARVTSMDFRVGEFAYTPDLGSLSRSLGVTAALVVLTLLLWIGALGTQLWVRGARAEALETRIGELYSTTFDGAPAPEGDPFDAMELRTRETRALANHLGVTGNGLSALEVLRELSAKIPAELDVGLTELNIERHTIQARGRAKDFESVDRVRAELAGHAWFDDVRLTDVVTDPRRGGKSFNLQIRLSEGS